MYYVDMPNAEEIGALNSVRSEACISIYLPTTPVSRETEQSRINLGNLVKKAVTQLEGAGFDKKRIASLQTQFADLLADDEFWNYQANTLAILATPDSLHTYRMASKLNAIVEVSDRFHLKPLLRAITFPHAAHVLALSENAVRLIAVSADLPARQVDVQNMPTDAATAGGKATNKDYSGTGHRHGSQGDSFYLTRFVRKLDAALRPVLTSSDLPLILATTKPLEALFRSISVIPALPSTISGNPDLSESDLASAARPVLDAHYAEQVKAFHQLFEERAGKNRTTTDISDAARLATFGGIDRLLVDIDCVLDGSIDDETGAVSFSAEGGDAVNYDIVDEITGRALRSGAKVMAVRAADIPGGQSLAVISRYPI